jgi:hypothetical protein
MLNRRGDRKVLMGPRILIRLGPYLVDGVDLHLESVAVVRVRWLLLRMFLFWLALYLLINLAGLSSRDAGMICTKGWIFFVRRISCLVRSGGLSLSFPGALVLVANYRFLSEGVRVVQLSHIIYSVLLSELKGLIRMSLGDL